MVPELRRNIRAGERKCQRPWQSMSLIWSLDPKGSSQEGTESELDRTTWVQASGCREEAPGCPTNGHCLNLLASHPLLRSKDGPCRGHPLGSVHPMELGLTATAEPQALGA